jgi:Mlc titration factor MtfA (ptsG expression regulator)
VISAISMRNRFLAQTHKPLPATLWLSVLQRIPYASRLSASDQARLQCLVLDFLETKYFEGAHGFVVDDVIRLEIATQACLLILNIGMDFYRGWQSIIVYPGDFIVGKSVVDSDGVVHEWMDEISGESWEQGPVILSWDACTVTAPDYNVVLHEFAHKLDLLDGTANGCPPLPPDIQPNSWAEDFSAGYTLMIDSLEKEAPLPLDAYAAENPAEFFAVLCEQFFLQPDLVYNLFPRIYRHLMTFFRQDPLALVYSR